MQVTKLYSSTEQLIVSINSAVGINLVLGTISALISFSYTILIMINPSVDFTMKLTQTLVVAGFVVCFGLAAEGGCKVWLFH